MTYATFAPSPIAGQLVVLDSGMTLTTAVDAAKLAGSARGTVPQSDGTHGAEFVFWGNAALAATVGILPSTATLDAEVGVVAGIGWRLHAGEVVCGGDVLVANLPVITLAEIVGIRAMIDGGNVTLDCYRGDELLASVTVALAAPIHFAVSLASDTAGELRCIVNAGQWRGIGPAAGAGWATAAETFGVVHLGSEDYMSTGADTPADTAWQGIIASAGLSTVASISFWPWGTSSRSGTAQVRVLDADGALDAITLGAARDVPVRVRQVAQGAALSSAADVARYVLDRIDVEDDGVKSLVLRDAHDDLDTPLRQAVFLPSLSDSLAWQPQPVVIGLVRSVPGTAINSDGSVQWLCDAPLASVGAVLDRGAEIEAGTGYALSDDGQQIALYSPPLAPVLADVSTEAGMAPASLRAVLGNLFGRIGKASWAGGDAEVIDSATSYAGIGYYDGDGATAREALDNILPSYGADWYDDNGVLRIVRLFDPDIVDDADLAFELDWRELQADLTVLPDLAPNLSRRMSYQPNAAPLDSGDMITDVVQLTPARRQQLAADARGQVYAAAPLPARYAHAETAVPMPSRFDRREDAQDEIDRIIALYAVPRFFYAGKLMARPDLSIRPGQVGRITYHRYGLAGGRKVLVAGVTSNRVTGEHTLKFWGA